MNLLRLVLASVVLVSHAWSLGGFGDSPTVGHTPLATLAVYGFFGLSGYLIAGSKLRSTAGRYLWHRLLRIMPAYWVMLVVVAFAFAPAAGLLEHGGYNLHQAVGFVTRNIALVVEQPTIGDTLRTAPYGPLWNGSTWTLIYEFLCYLVILALGLCRVLHRPWLVFGAWAACCVALGLHLVPHVLVATVYLPTAVNFLIVFMAGSVLRLVRRRVPLRTDVALLAAVLTVVSLFLPVDPTPVAAFPLCYLLLWLGDTIPASEFLSRNDFSYGVYIWAWPVQQLAVVGHLAAHGVWLYLLACAVVVACLGIASWTQVERRALLLKDWTPRLAPSRSP